MISKDIYIRVDAEGVYLAAPERHEGLIAAQHATHVFAELLGSRHGGNAPLVRMLRSASRWLHNAKRYDVGRGMEYPDDEEPGHDAARSQLADVYLILGAVHMARTFGGTGTDKMDEAVAFADDLAELVGEEMETLSTKRGRETATPQRLHNYEGPSTPMQQRFCTECGGSAVGKLPEGGQCPFCDATGTLV